VLEEKLRCTRRRLRETVVGLRVSPSDAAALERSFFESSAVIQAWIERCRPVASRIVPDELLAQWLASTNAAIFEGAQGLLLDETHGFHPWTTWSNCTADHARDLVRESTPETELRVIGILRAHTVRHGPGPLPTEDAALDDLAREHNTTNAWPGKVRRGWFDAVLARHALALTPQLDALMVTHVDALARREEWHVCDAYTAGTSSDADLVTRAADSRITDLIARARPALERQERLGQFLMGCRPQLVRVSAADYVNRLEEFMHRPIDVVSHGPSADSIELRSTAIATPAGHLAHFE
jgi:adenylosuccinate synthase